MACHFFKVKSSSHPPKQGLACKWGCWEVPGYLLSVRSGWPVPFPTQSRHSPVQEGQSWLTFEGWQAWGQLWDPASGGGRRQEIWPWLSLEMLLPSFQKFRGRPMPVQWTYMNWKKGNKCSCFLYFPISVETWKPVYRMQDDWPWRWFCRFNDSLKGLIAVFAVQVAWDRFRSK